jgi:hypothetical protein
VKVAYSFATSGHTASYKRGTMILPQLEEGRHGVEVVGMMFFDDNTYVPRKGDRIGERVGKIACESGMLLMLCDQCAVERGLATCDEASRYTFHATSWKMSASAASPICTPPSPPTRPTTSSRSNRPRLVVPPQRAYRPR